MSDKEYAFEMATSQIRFGSGATREVGMDLVNLGVKKVLLITDPVVRNLQPFVTVQQSLDSQNINYEVYDEVRVEPSEESMLKAIDFTSKGNFDAFVAVGGGSTLDTAKATNLYSTYPADFLTYVNAPIGAGQPVPGPLKPLIAIPTTAGTGSETTGVAIFDLLDRKLKTGIASRMLKPMLGIVDPENTRTLPPLAIAAPGLDVLCHAIESFTALPYQQRPRPEQPHIRPAYQGSNPISDIWVLQALKMIDKYLIRAYRDPDDEEARGQMLLASSYAGMGFGNSGVHLCHGMSYPISSKVRDYYPPGYPEDHPIVPHGLSVALTAPAVFRFTSSACPERHLLAAQCLGADVRGVDAADAGEAVAQRLIEILRTLDMPNGLAAIGYTADDALALAEGTLPQHRVTKLSPRPAEKDDLVELFKQSLVLW